MVKLLFAIFWCIFTYYFSVKNNPEYGAILLLSISFIMANIYFYHQWKQGEITPFITGTVIIIPLVIYSILLIGIFSKIIPSSTANYLINHSKTTHRIYLFSIDGISMFCSMIILTPISIYVYRNSYKIIIILITLINIMYPQLYVSNIKLLPFIGITSAHLLGSLIAIYLAKQIILRRGYIIERNLN
jgi:hypothetical protein